jgi:hypothetical protein
MLSHTNEQPTLFDAEVSGLQAVAESIPEQPIAEPMLNQILTGPSPNSSIPEKEEFRAVSPMAFCGDTCYVAFGRRAQQLRRLAPSEHHIT